MKSKSFYFIVCIKMDLSFQNSLRSSSDIAQSTEGRLESGASTESILMLVITLASIIVLITCLLCCYCYVISRIGQERYEENNHQQSDFRPGNLLTLNTI